MSDFASLRAQLKPALEMFEKTLAGLAKSFEPEIRPVVAEVLKHTGKHLRPMFLFACAGVEISTSERAQRLAAVVELIHLASLVHDDILDGALERHGAPAHHRVFDPQISVLTGDALFLQANLLAAREDDATIGRAVAEAAKATCSGEIAQGLAERFTKGRALTEAEYFRQLLLKTGRLFGLSCELGARVRGADEKTAAAYRAAGENFGVAYQLYDDAVDVWGDEKVFKKTLGTDQAQHKWTLPWIYLAQKVDAKKMEALWADRKAALKAMEAHGIKTQTREIFEKYLADASKGISIEILVEFADYLRQMWGKLD